MSPSLTGTSADVFLHFRNVGLDANHHASDRGIRLKLLHRRFGLGDGGQLRVLLIGVVLRQFLQVDLLLA